MEKLFEELFSLLEEYLNEFSAPVRQSASALVEQYFINRLETPLAVSNECFEEICALIEGDLIDFQARKNEKTLAKNVQELARMVENGELKAVRTLPNGEVMGDPHYVKKLNDMKQENMKILMGANSKKGGIK